MPWNKPVGSYPKNWDLIKAGAIDRASNRCEICKKVPDNLKKNFNPMAHDNYTTQRFRVHHKDNNKNNNDPKNLVYVCMKCHGRLHREMNRRGL